jgi:SNF2 family DNA or RNA helicase
MSLRFKNGLISIEHPSGEFSLTSEEIYATVFEGQVAIRGQPIHAQDFHQLGLSYSDSPVTPAILISAQVSNSGEPEIRCELGGQIGDSIAVSAGDYVVSNDRWYPLPKNTSEEFGELLAELGISDACSIHLGQYLEILNRAKNFTVKDRAAEQMAACALSLRFSSPPPIGLAATPYPYQQSGLQWLGFMARHGVGSILADEMGLGKTLQVIAVLLAQVQTAHRPNLVVCPATLLENWRRELARFAPSLAVLIHAGPRRTGSVNALTVPDVTIASYETVAGDISLFRAVNWNIVALDEAQNIKNPEARRTRYMKELKKRVGIAITGTPVENRLTDLWSLCDFVLPGHLGTQREFEKRFPETEVGAQDVEPIVSAIMLRRRVRDVAKDLPARIDIPVPLVMDDRSIEAYEEIRKEAIAKAPQAPDLAAIIYLRMFCAHPWTVKKLREAGTAIECSPKMRRCFEILEEIFAMHSKAIIFTSFNETADLLANEITRIHGVPTWQINGSVPVPDRQRTVDEFSYVVGGAALVLNPKAAGVGLNITAANHVIHFNLEWNPAIEDQASARSHRRGQKLPVTVHRLFYANTVEEIINDRMTRKRALSERAVIGTAGDAEDLSDILHALNRSPAE